MTHIQSFARLYCYGCHYRTKPEATTGTLSPGPDCSNFTLLPLYIGDFKNLKFPEREFLTSSEEKGTDGASVVVTF